MSGYTHSMGSVEACPIVFDGVIRRRRVSSPLFNDRPRIAGVVLLHSWTHSACPRSGTSGATTARADQDGWPAARFLFALAEHESAERDV